MSYSDVMMEFHPPPDLTRFEVLFDSSEPHGALPHGLLRFAGNIGFPSPPGERPWVFANFVQSIDGVVSFGGTRPGGEWIARSRHDRWMMDLLRAHADALICGARSLALEARYGKITGGPVYRIVDPELLRFREQALGLGKLKNIVVTGSGALRPGEYRLFQSPHVEAWIATSPDGRRALGEDVGVRLLTTGEGSGVDLKALVRLLRQEHGVRYLLCEGGPTLYGEMLRAGLIDEKFLTISPQEVGSGMPLTGDPEQIETDASMSQRPSSISGPGFTIETARWYRWISSRRAGDHEFNRYRAVVEPRSPSSDSTRV